ncbi:MAG: hypothetical protein NC392_03275 [Roseburia sp.]|nr:hypothetical protein [Roseburia sp.]
MKKRKVRQAVLFALLAVTGICLLSCRNVERAENIENPAMATEEAATPIETIIVEEQYHKRDEICGASFPMWSVEREGISYGFKQSVFTEEEAAGYVQEMEEYINALKRQMQDVDFFPRNIELQVLVLDDIATIDLSKSDEVLILTKEELEDERYRFPLFLSVSKLDETSRNFGAYTYISGMDFDNDRIKEYLSRQENRQVLDLFYARRSEVYGSREDIEIFEQILASMAAEEIKESGLNGYFKETFTESAINDWLDKIGLTDAEELYEKANLEYSSQLKFKRDGQYDLHIESGNVTYLLESCASAFESALELEEFIVTEIKTREAMETYLKAHHVTTSPMFDSEYQLVYKILGDRTSKNYWEFCDDNSSCIYIFGNYKGFFQESMTHELTHAYVGRTQEDVVWMNEGFAEYFSRAIFPQPSRREAFYESIGKAEADTACLWRNNYVAMEGVPDSIEDFELSSFLDGCVMAYWDGDTTLEQVTALEVSLWEWGDIAEKTENGAELSYWETESFVSYLLGRSSFETTWNCMINNLDCQEVYGKTYDELKLEWSQSIRERVSGDLQIENDRNV